MPVIRKRNCDNCGKHYESTAKRFCSLMCRNKNRLGFKHSAETRKKIGDGNRGKIVGESTRLKMRVSKKKQFESGYKVWCEGLTKNDDERIALRGIESAQSRIQNRSQRGFKNSGWKGGVSKSKYSWDWKRISRILKELRGFTCEVCRKKSLGRSLDVHHKNFNKLDNRTENLIVLCRKCHRRVHPLMHQESLEN